MKKLILSLMLSCLVVDALAQSNIIRLKDVIETAQNQSYEYKTALSKYYSEFWNFQNFKSSFLPVLALSGTIPDYSRNINKITLPTGEDTFVSQNQSFSTLSLDVSQNVAQTGGQLSVRTTLSRIDIFGSNKQTVYSTIPISISYRQGNIGYNSFKWQKKIDPLRFESASRELISSLEQIAQKSVSIYFDLLTAENQIQLSKQNLSTTDTLLRIATDRLKLLSIGQSEILQLELNSLNVQKKVREDSIRYEIAKQQMVKFLLIDQKDWRLALPEELKIFDLNFESVLSKALENSQQVVNFKIKRMESERYLEQMNAENKLKFNLQMNFGLSNTGQNLSDVFYNLSNQQNFSLGFSLPILDWGHSKTQKLRAKSNLDMVKNEIQVQQTELEQEVAINVAKWSSQIRNVKSAKRAKEIGNKNYELELARFKNGRISLNDLNIAQSSRDASNYDYIESLKVFWEVYFSIRRLTLFDFENNKKIIVKEISK